VVGCLQHNRKEPHKQIHSFSHKHTEQDINQNYLEEEESDDYIDITDSEELEE